MCTRQIFYSRFDLFPWLLRLWCESVVRIFGDLDEHAHVNFVPLQNVTQISSDFMGLSFPNIKKNDKSYSLSKSNNKNSFIETLLCPPFKCSHDAYIKMDKDWVAGQKGSLMTSIASLFPQINCHFFPTCFSSPVFRL